MTDMDWQSEVERIAKYFPQSIDMSKSETERPIDGPIRVLIVSSYMLYPFTSGGVLRMVSPLTKMSDDISVDILFSTFAENSGELCKRHLEELTVVNKAYYSVAEKEKYTNDGLPDDIAGTVSRALLEKLLGLIRHNSYDVVQVEHSQFSWIVPFIRVVDNRCKILLDEHNIEYRLYEKWLEYDDDSSVREKMVCLKEWEEKIWQWFDGIMTVSTVESGIIKKSVPETSVEYIPTGGGVDIEKYRYRGESKDIDILFIGSQDWIPNVHGLLWFINNVFSVIEKTRPGTNFCVVGNSVTRNELIAAASYSGNIKFMGFQEDDANLFHRSKVVIVPLFIGAGARVKIPTAMATSTPVVSTTFGAEGTDVTDGVNIILADEPVDFAGAVIKLLNDEKHSKMISDNAKEFVEQFFSVEKVSKLQADMYRSMTDRSFRAVHDT